MKTPSETTQTICVTTAALQACHIYLPDLFRGGHWKGPAHYLPAKWNTTLSAWEIQGSQMKWYVPEQMCFKILGTEGQGPDVQD